MLLIILLLVVNAALVVTIAFREVRRPVRGLAWIVIGTALPIVGFLIYFVLSRPLRKRREDRLHPAPETATEILITGIQNTEIHHTEIPIPFSSEIQEPDHEDTAESDLPSVARTIAHSVHSITNLYPVRGTVQLLINGSKTYDALVGAVRSASQTIDLEYYIYRYDHIGELLTEALIERAKAGVRIRFMRDGLGSRKFPQVQIRRMQQSGIECRTFYPFRFPWLTPKVNHRDHCKIVTIDGKQAYVGGINIGDEYTGKKPKIGFWRDTHLEVNGEAVRDIQAVFEVNWDMATPERPVHVDSAKPSSHPLDWSRPGVRSALASWSVEWGAEWLSYTDAPAEQQTECLIQTVESGPDRPIQTVRHLFFVAITQAMRELEITTPYFVPDADLTMALKAAVSRGVRVRLLVPLQPDHKIIGLAAQTFYPELLEAGVEIYQYHKGILHSKTMAVDGVVSIVGAANYDLRSFRLNYEICEVIYGEHLARELHQQFERDLLDAIPMRLEEMNRKGPWTKTKERSARLLAPLL